MASELNVLARMLDRISEQHRWSRDFTLESLHDALSDAVSCFPIYRTYIHSDAQQVEPEDERYIRLAISVARQRNPAISASIFDFIQSVLLLDDPDGLSDGQRAERRLFVMRLQQYTGPVMAKGMEDTAFYRFYPLASLNEVGGDPYRFGISRDISTRGMPPGGASGQTPCWPPRHTIPSAARMSARESMSCPIPRRMVSRAPLMAEDESKPER